MSKEIERKFLVADSSYKSLATPTYNRQGYIPTMNGMTVRIRIAGEQGFVTFKDKTIGCSRNEFEYSIPLDDAKHMLSHMCATPTVEKWRYRIPAQADGLVWEVDEFMGDNEGLVIAEIELPTEDHRFERPTWLGKEVTGQREYYNSYLCRHPYKQWKE